jgi:hypothetical protein
MPFSHSSALSRNSPISFSYRFVSCLSCFFAAGRERAYAQEEKDYYDDLETELELADEDEPVLYKMGEAFFYLSLPAAKKQLRHVIILLLLGISFRDEVSPTCLTLS